MTALPGPIVSTEEPLALALAAVTQEHGFNGMESKNLGYYRTEVTCACGETLWWGEHEGDPNWRDVWVEGHLGVKLAEAARAYLVSERRAAVARLLDPIAFDPERVYSAESRGAATSGALRAADNLLAVLP